MKEDWKKKQLGLCRRRKCGNFALPGYDVCEPCREKIKKTRADRYEKKVSTGTCQRCNEPAVPGNRMCQDHREGRVAENKAYRDKLISQGRCPRCSQLRHPDMDHESKLGDDEHEPVEHDYSDCLRCRERLDSGFKS